MNKVARVNAAFWVIKIAGTTLGETAGDLLTKPMDKGGLNLGTIGSSLVPELVFVACIIYTTRRERLYSTAP